MSFDKKSQHAKSEREQNESVGLTQSNEATDPHEKRNTVGPRKYLSSTQLSHHNTLQENVYLSNTDNKNIQHKAHKHRELSFEVVSEHMKERDQDHEEEEQGKYFHNNETEILAVRDSESEIIKVHLAEEKKTINMFISEYKANIHKINSFFDLKYGELQVKLGRLNDNFLELNKKKPR